MFKDKVDPLQDFRENGRPEALDEDADAVDKEIVKELVKQYVSAEVNIRRNIQNTYGLVSGQCSVALRATGSLTLKKSIGIDGKDNPRGSYHDALILMYKMKQGKNEANDAYLERFKANINTVELAKGKSVFCVKEIMEPDEDKQLREREIYDESKLCTILIYEADFNTGTKG